MSDQSIRTTQPPNPARDRTEMPDEIWAYEDIDFRRGWFDMTVSPKKSDRHAKYTRTQTDQPSDESRALLSIVNKQAEDEGLWFCAETAPEAYLQQELRKLHAAIEAYNPAAQKPAAVMDLKALKHEVENLLNSGDLETIDDVFDYLAARYNLFNKQGTIKCRIKQ
jgi:hypothetical protein